MFYLFFGFFVQEWERKEGEVIGPGCNVFSVVSHIFEVYTISVTSIFAVVIVQFVDVICHVTFLLTHLISGIVVLLCSIAFLVHIKINIIVDDGALRCDNI